MGGALELLLVISICLKSDFEKINP